MSTIGRFFLVTTLLAGTGTIVAQSSEQPFSIAISAQHAVVKAGSAVKVKIVLTNTSNHVISIYGNNGEDSAEVGGYDAVDVRDCHGNPPPLTKRGRAVIKGEDIVVSSGGYAPLQPSRSQSNNMLITKLFDLSQPGKYTIQVQRLDEESKTFVKSNTITVTVTP